MIACNSESTELFSAWLKSIPEVTINLTFWWQVLCYNYNLNKFCFIIRTKRNTSKTFIPVVWKEYFPVIGLLMKAFNSAGPH